MNIPLICVLIFYGAMSLIALVTYGADKHKARSGAWRIPEKVLLLLSFFGGAAGGTLAMVLFRHKTRHWYFWFVNIVGLVWQAALAVSLVILL